MMRFLHSGATMALCTLAVAATLQGQAPRTTWNDAQALELAQRATARRLVQLADTGLRDYAARAHGYLTFLAQSGEGLTEPPRIVKADELQLDVFWAAPDRSKQRIVGRRDTLLLPTDINYHRDHLGIIQNNFPEVIRLGDGDEVLDVPHPLSPAGQRAYEFRVADSVRLRLPDRSIEVYRLDVRPTDPAAPRAVGALFIERATAQLVRMSFSFTRSALKDESLDDVHVILENSLVEGRFWLPRRQEIEIQRSGTWLDFPFRGIIRGRWEIREYTVNEGLDPGLFIGEEIEDAPAPSANTFRFTGAILDGLPPDVRAATDDDIRAVQTAARELVRAQALERTRRTSLRAQSLADLVRVNRVEGLALGVGVARRLGNGLRVDLGARYGTADAQLRGRAAIGREWASGAGISVRGDRLLGDVGLTQETSLTRNSLAAQEFGSDWTSPWDLRRATLRVDLPALRERRWRVGLDVVLESHRPLAVQAIPARGTYEPTPAVERSTGTVRGLGLDVHRPTALAWWGTEVTTTLRTDLRVGTLADGAGLATARHWLRSTLLLDVQRPIGRDRLVLRTLAGSAVRMRGALPVQGELWLGGPISAPGVPFHELRGTAAASQRIEWQHPIGGPRLPLGRFGRVPMPLTLAPYTVMAWSDGRTRSGTLSRTGVSPSVGVALLGLFDLVRLDVAHAPRQRAWLVSVDVTREFWRIL